MSVLDLIQVLGFALTCLIAGYNLGKRKKPPIVQNESGYMLISFGLTVYRQHLL